MNKIIIFNPFLLPVGLLCGLFTIGPKFNWLNFFTISIFTTLILSIAIQLRGKNRREEWEERNKSTD